MAVELTIDDDAIALRMHRRPHISSYNSIIDGDVISFLDGSYRSHHNRCTLGASE
jgi:hypothetical protein